MEPVEGNLDSHLADLVARGVRVGIVKPIEAPRIAAVLTVAFDFLAPRMISSCMAPPVSPRHW